MQKPLRETRVPSLKQIYLADAKDLKKGLVNARFTNGAALEEVLSENHSLHLSPVC